MTDARDLVPVQREIQLSKQYIALEQMRMGNRLNVEWNIHELPETALIPPLLLQPLLENAVYHGIESLTQGGVITVIISLGSEGIRISVENPHATGNVPSQEIEISRDSGKNDGSASSASGSLENQRRNNKMALLNIRERLDLLFDAEARYHVENGIDFYRVEIVLPHIKERPS